MPCTRYKFRVKSPKVFFQDKEFIIQMTLVILDFTRDISAERDRELFINHE